MIVSSRKKKAKNSASKESSKALKNADDSVTRSPNLHRAHVESDSLTKTAPIPKKNYRVRAISEFNPTRSPSILRQPTISRISLAVSLKKISDKKAEDLLETIRECPWELMPKYSSPSTSFFKGVFKDVTFITAQLIVEDTDLESLTKTIYSMEYIRNHPFFYSFSHVEIFDQNLWAAQICFSDVKRNPSTDYCFLISLHKLTDGYIVLAHSISHPACPAFPMLKREEDGMYAWIIHEGENEAKQKALFCSYYTEVRNPSQIDIRAMAAKISMQSLFKNLVSTAPQVVSDMNKLSS